MNLLDWSIVGAYFVFSAVIGIIYARRAGGSMQDFFLSGRNLPWWLAGTSMVATTFAADTPLAVTELVAKNGIAGNWLWWNFLFGGMLTVFFFARLWRRAGILTDVEFVELRYSGKPAAFLRGFRSLYLGIFINCIILGWVNLAMAAILEGMFGIPHSAVMYFVGASLLVTAVYSAVSGLWGVAVTRMMCRFGSLARRRTSSKRCCCTALAPGGRAAEWASSTTTSSGAFWRNASWRFT